MTAPLRMLLLTVAFAFVSATAHAQDLQASRQSCA
jgi:hypothetical protein